MPNRPPAHRPHGASKASKPFADQPQASPSRRGYGRDWQALRIQKLQADPLCEFHKDRGKIVLAEVVDHIKPISEALELRLDWDNLRSLCKECHDKYTLAEASPAARPRGLRPSRIPLTILCGPAGSGKSTWIEKHAGPNDLIIDLAWIKANLANGAEHFGIGGPLLKRALVQRNRMLAGGWLRRSRRADQVQRVANHIRSSRHASHESLVTKDVCT